MDLGSFGVRAVGSGRGPACGKAATSQQRAGPGKPGVPSARGPDFFSLTEPDSLQFGAIQIISEHLLWSGHSHAC